MIFICKYIYVYISRYLVLDVTTKSQMCITYRTFAIAQLVLVFSTNHVLNFGMRLLSYIILSFRTSCFCCFLARQLYPKMRIDPGKISLLVKHIPVIHKSLYFLFMVSLYIWIHICDVVHTNTTWNGRFGYWLRII